MTGARSRPGIWKSPQMGSDIEIEAGCAGSRASAGVGSRGGLGLGTLRARGSDRAPGSECGHTCAVVFKEHRCELRTGCSEERQNFEGC